jgi:hypothetical protein
MSMQGTLLFVLAIGGFIGYVFVREVWVLALAVACLAISIFLLARVGGQLR